MMIKSTQIKLKDGRQLAYAEFGDPDGKPLMLFHGAPGSRLECHPDHDSLVSRNIRLIVPDRPGYGRSDPAPGRSLLSWADDAAELASSLTIDSCPVIGFSGGGPYAMACAYRIPEQISRLGLVSSVAPFNVPGTMDEMNEQSKALYTLAKSDPAAFAAQIQTLATSGEVVYQIMTAGLPPEDKALFDDESLRNMYLADMTESIHSGAEGIVSDMLLYTQPWKFEPGGINCETLLWQGDKDINVPPAMGQYLANVIPGCHSHFISDQAHYLFFSHWREILAVMAA